MTELQAALNIQMRQKRSSPNYTSCIVNLDLFCKPDATFPARSRVRFSRYACSSSFSSAAAERNVVTPLGPYIFMITHSLQSSSFLGFIFKILEGNPKRELLWSLWVLPIHGPNFVRAGINYTTASGTRSVSLGAASSRNASTSIRLIFFFWAWWHEGHQTKKTQCSPDTGLTGMRAVAVPGSVGRSGSRSAAAVAAASSCPARTAIK